uniref:Uncharacterized protein n=1 Tax=Arundo donax TaxID=35708 RepID=A0A0A8Y8N8_ARUDO
MLSELPQLGGVSSILRHFRRG